MLFETLKQITFTFLFVWLCNYEVCDLAADYKRHKSGLDSFVFSMELSTLRNIVEKLGMYKSSFTEVTHFADAITHWVETNC